MSKTESLAESRARDIWRRTEAGDEVSEDEIIEDVLEYLNEWCRPSLEVATYYELGEY